jgi:hypothetical protein
MRLELEAPHGRGGLQRRPRGARLSRSLRGRRPRRLP